MPGQANPPGRGKAPVSLSLAVSVLMADGWHDIVRGSLAAVIDPAFIDPNSGQLVTPGEPWLEFLDTTGHVYACPMRRGVLGVKMASLVGEGAPLDGQGTLTATPTVSVSATAQEAGQGTLSASPAVA